jgi:hypothetical protein
MKNVWDTILACIGGIGFLAITIYVLYTGELESRYSPVIRRSERPFAYWAAASFCMIISAILVITAVLALFGY